MSNLVLVKSETFGTVQCDFYRGKKEIWMTRKQIGEALGYADPEDAIRKIHERHKERLDKFSVTDKMSGTDGKKYDTYLYSAKGVYEICRWSQQPKADQFFDWVYDMLEGLRTGKIRMEYNGPKFTPRMALDVAKFVSKELKDKQPNPITLTILQDIFAQSGIVIPLDEYRKQAEELKRIQEEHLAQSKKNSLLSGTIPKGAKSRVRELREAKGWSQEMLANKVGVSRPVISHAENGTKGITRHTWEGICKALEVTLEEVFPMEDRVN